MGDDFSVSTKCNQPPPAEKLGDSRGTSVAKEKPYRKKKRVEGQKIDVEKEEQGKEPVEEACEEKQSGKVLDIIV